MMQGLLNAMRLQAMLESGSRVSTLMGKVKGYNDANYSAKVMIQPDDVETGWLPIASPWVGNGWGMVAPPADGDVVAVIYQEEDINAGIISLRLFNANASPPSVQSGSTTTYAQSGEFWLVHQTGSLLKFHNDGSVELTSNKNLALTVGGDLNATVTGALNATVQNGDATVTASKGNATINASNGKATVSASEVDLIGANGQAKGIVQADCVCAFTGSPHPMVSGTVKGSL